MLIRTIVAVSLLASAVAAVAAGSGSPKGVQTQNGVNGNSGPNTKEKLTGTYIAVGNGNSTGLTPFTFTTVASSSVKCSNAAGCTIGIGAMAQMQTSGGDWAICLSIDGGYVECQYQGVQSGPSSFVVGNARGTGTVAVGTHTVNLDLYGEGSAPTYQYFQMDTAVYKP
jgi:hypothetical protein